MRQKILGLLLVALCTATACGTRVEREAGSGVSTPQPAAGSSAPAANGATPAVDGSAPAADSGTPMANTPAGSATGSAPGASAAAGGAASSTPRPKAAAGSASTGTGGTGSTAAGSGAAESNGAAKPPNAKGNVPGPRPTPGAPQSSAQPATKSPVVVASVGSYSGVAGSVIVPFLRGAQIWVKQANQTGGLNGHPIDLVIFDDGTDPARHRAQVQQAVEQRKAIALFAQGEGFTGQGSLEYLKSKGIPVIGTELAESWGYESPLYFMQATAADALTYTALATAAQQVLPQGKQKLGSIACNEVQFCENAHRLTAAEGPKLGFEVAYRGRASIAQPDFTAECLAASRAGVQVMFVAMDGNSLGRIASACARQNFRPTFTIFSSLVNNKQKDDPNLDGMVASTTVFPWFQKGTPATDQYQKAFAAFGSGLDPGAGPATGWTAGVLLGRAGANLPEPPTTQALLDGLWSMKGDTLGGITQPLTFVKDQPAKPLACWFNLVIRDNAWVNPDNNKLSCASPFG